MARRAIGRGTGHTQSPDGATDTSDGGGSLPSTLPLPLAPLDQSADTSGDDDEGDTPRDSIPVRADIVIDPSTGEILSPEEASYQARIADERDHGLVALDVSYAAHAEAIHEPLDRRRERGTADEDAWRVPRANHTRLEVPFADLQRLATTDDGDLAAIQQFALHVARNALGEPAAGVMKLLYVYANDAGHQPRVTIQLGALMDALGYQRDSRGSHYTTGRRKVSQILLALQVTRVGLSVDRDGRQVGILASLISALEYDMSRRKGPAPDGPLSAEDAFARGLPETITVTINPAWYGLRDAMGKPTGAYALVERARLLPGAPGDTTGGTGTRRASAVEALRHYIATVGTHIPHDQLVLARHALLERAHITDRNRTNATRTLTRALDRLLAEGAITGYRPSPLPLDQDALITIDVPR